MRDELQRGSAVPIGSAGQALALPFKVGEKKSPSDINRAETPETQNSLHWPWTLQRPSTKMMVGVTNPNRNKSDVRKSSQSANHNVSSVEVQCKKEIPRGHSEEIPCSVIIDGESNKKRAFPNSHRLSVCPQIISSAQWTENTETTKHGDTSSAAKRDIFEVVSPPNLPATATPLRGPPQHTKHRRGRNRSESNEVAIGRELFQ